MYYLKPRPLMIDRYNSSDDIGSGHREVRSTPSCVYP